MKLRALLETAQELDNSTTRKNLKTVAREMQALFGHVPANQLTSLHITAITRAWRERLNKWTQCARTTQLRKLLRYIAAITGQPEIKVKWPGAGKRRVRIATEAERQAIWQAAGPALRMCLVFWTELGIRFTEPLSIRPEDIDHHNNTVSCITKNQKFRTLPLTAKLQELLAAAEPLAPQIPIIRQLARCRGDLAWNIRRQWIKAKRAAGVDFNLRVHDLRRTMATTLYRATLDTVAVQDALGHENLATTASYLAPTEPERLKDMMNSITWRWKQ